MTLFKKIFAALSVAAALVMTAFLVQSCGIYSFTGTSIQPDVKTITINYFDENFVEHTDTYNGFFARIVQHEYDHLEGHVFTDRVSPMRRQMIGGKLQNIQKGKVRCSYKTK